MGNELFKSSPANVEVEMTMLGCLINDSEKIHEVEGELTAEDFYMEKHKEIYKALLTLSRKESKIDLVTLLEEVKSNKKIDSCGGVTYITSLSTEAIYSNNIYAYSKIISDKAHRRRVIEAAKELIGDAYDNKPLNEIVGKMDDKIQQAIINKNIEDIKPISDCVNDLLSSIEQNHRNGGAITGKTTGFEELDHCLSGLNKGDFLIVAARPSMGKTAFALNIGQYASKESKVAIFSLEMNTISLMQRLLSSRCLIELQNIKTGKLSEEQFIKIARGANELATRNIHIDDRATSITDIKARCSQLKKKNGLDVVVIDYLQLIESTEKSQSREQEIAKVSRELKKMAMRLDLTVIALSQLSRAPEQRADRRPMLSDLRDSGSIEQDADSVMFLYRDEYYNKESEERNIAEVIVAKNRNGEVKTIKLAWVGQYQKFAKLDFNR